MWRDSESSLLAARGYSRVVEASITISGSRMIEEEFYIRSVASATTIVKIDALSTARE